jgi:hypothetical protein
LERDRFQRSVSTFLLSLRACNHISCFCAHFRPSGFWLCYGLVYPTFQLNAATNCLHDWVLWNIIELLTFVAWNWISVFGYFSQWLFYYCSTLGTCT